MAKNRTDNKYANLKGKLKIDCGKCSGLCCVALYCMKTDGFPANKEAGVPCKHLMSDFRCDIHSELASKSMKGCSAYDCFGAGQKVTQICYPKADWKSDPNKANEMFEVFLTVFQLHQMEWYLFEALPLISDECFKLEIETLISANEQMTSLSPHEMLRLDVEQYRVEVNQILKQVGTRIEATSFDGAHSKDYFGRNFKRSNLNGRNFSMAFLIAANLEGCSLQGTNFLGADLRDANIRNTDLSASVFLTQMQINSTKGNSNTKLPVDLVHPVSWQG